MLLMNYHYIITPTGDYSSNTIIFLQPLPQEGKKEYIQITVSEGRIVATGIANIIPEGRSQLVENREEFILRLNESLIGQAIQ